MATTTPADPSYTVFVRLPFPRGDFVDPAPVEWDAVKDKALWKVLSKASKNSDIDWTELATKFDVTLAFLLQQAAWLYERQLSQVRAQMRKVGASKGSSAPSPVPGSISETGETIKTGSGVAGQRVPSSLSTRKESPIPRDGTPLTPALGTTPPSIIVKANKQASPLSRNNSHNTTLQSRNAATPQSNRRSLSPKPRPSTTAEPALPSPSSSTTSSSSSGAPVQSRLLRRPRFTASDDEDDEPPFLPFTSSGPAAHQESIATLRGDPKKITSGRRPTNMHKPSLGKEKVQASQTSDSSSGAGGKGKLVGTLSPRRTAELKGAYGKDSEGAPSMGSSFSDLEDASVTQSALEEALASNMQAGGMASRMSSISNALKSRYL